MKNKTILSLAMILAGTAIVAAKPQKERQGPPSHADFMEQFDTDGDGTISEAERESARETMKSEGRRPGGRQGQIRQKMIEKFDADGDGKLTGDERKQAREAIRQQRQLRHFDADGDGQLNAAEQAEAQAFEDERKAQMLERFDADGDGLLSDEERQNAKQAMRKAGPRGQKSQRGGDREGRGPKPPSGQEAA
ncbi:hypothetical protein [Rubellicoccus peritrichatus]|uniref:EF-hand domain-containing protein n=1 Tax=Rubellicoccus peritrichatus TaxID=3080537 RepID=A0AAQ3QXW2_9BACT|nr:hypothetical protein [Puniceicoccus sp. CR14]WOO43230.1 hypothetical protein RZN69_09025 [Puniceicoccus sp. CR14]